MYRGLSQAMFVQENLQSSFSFAVPSLVAHGALFCLLGDPNSENANVRLVSYVTTFLR